MAEIIQTAKQHICDFCGRTQEAAEILIVSPSKNADICEQCVATCAELIAQHRAAPPSNTIHPEGKAE
jgi:ATP-dependent protease Clp ATPase subunit